jgi:hypothetical protein
MWQRIFRGRKTQTPASHARPGTAMPAGSPPAAPAALPTMPLAEIVERFHRFVFDLPDGDGGGPGAAELATL